MDDALLRSAQSFKPCTLCDGIAEYHCDTCGDDLCQVCRKGHLRSNASKLHQVVSYSDKYTDKALPEKTLPHPRILNTPPEIAASARNAECITEEHELCREISLDDQTVTASDFEPSDVTDSDFCDDFTIHSTIEGSNVAISEVVQNPDNARAEVVWESAQRCAEGQTTVKDNSDTFSESLGSAQCVIVKDPSDLSDVDVPSITWEKTVKMPTLNSKAGCHVTYVAPDKLWVSDMKGQLFLMDLHGNVLETIETRSGYGFHTVKQNGDLLYTDLESKQVIKMRFKQKKLGMKISSVLRRPLFKTSDWTPLCIHASRHNGDLLVGMVNGGRAGVARYDSSGREQQMIEFDNTNKPLYELPQYITENFNFDVITSDRTGIVVVDYSGKRKWSYSGSGKPTSVSGKTGICFLPAGICCDILLNIAVYDVFDNRVHLLNKDGKYLSRLLVLGNAWIPQGLCFDEQNNLYCGDRTKILVFKYEYLY